MTKSPSKVYGTVEKFGGVKALQNRLKGRSDVIAHNKEAIAEELVSMALTNLTDVITWDAAGNVKVKPSADIPQEALRALKKVKVSYVKGEPTLELELHDKVKTLQILAKASGLLDTLPESNAPSVVGIKMMGPDVIDAKYTETEPDGERVAEKEIPAADSSQSETLHAEGKG